MTVSSHQSAGGDPGVVSDENLPKYLIDGGTGMLK